MNTALTSGFTFIQLVAEFMKYVYICMLFVNAIIVQIYHLKIVSKI